MVGGHAETEQPTHAAILSRVAVTENKVDNIRDDLHEVRARVAAIETDLRAVREFLAGAKGGWKVLVAVGAVVTFIVGIAGWFAPTLIKRWLG